MSFSEIWHDYWSPHEAIDTSPKVSDEVKYTTCYMCACRCGIKVHMKDGAIRYIEGNPKHPVNRGVMCGKGASGIMQQQSPAKLRKPLMRVGERGSGEFREIEWDEAIATAVNWLSRIRAEDPKKLAFFTGRDQSQSMTGFWATQFGTPNFAAHGGFCSVNMAAAGMYTIGGSFWEFGEPDWERTHLFLMFGVAEDHDSNPIKIALSGLRRRGAKFISVNPVRTGYSAIADEWIGIRPGTDGLFVLSLIHELLRADQIDFAYLGRYTNAAWLVIQAPGSADDGLFARNAAGEPLVLDASGGLANALQPGGEARVVGEATLADGRRAVPVFQLVAERYLDPCYAPDAVAATCGQILGQNRLFMNRVTARGLGLADDDWVWVSSHAGRIKAQLKVMDGVNPDTVWTWNAIGKRSGAWNLAADSPEFTRGFLLNHLITEMLPENDGDAGANADPITGQAAWYDLRVRVEKALPAEAGDSAPRFPAMARLPSLMPPPSLLRYGARHESDEPQERAP
jgi:anaerobic selenocysteine-containing dehydrogenase